MRALHARLGTFRGAALIVWGTSGPLRADPRASPRRAGVYPHAAVLEIERCGHCPEHRISRTRRRTHARVRRVNSPVAHAFLVDLAFERDRSRRKDRRDAAARPRIATASTRDARSCRAARRASRSARARRARRARVAARRCRSAGRSRTRARSPRSRTHVRFALRGARFPSVAPSGEGSDTPAYVCSMIARILDGRALALELRDGLARRAAAFRAHGVVPHLRVVMVGEDESSLAYVRGMASLAAKIGIDLGVDVLPPASRDADVRAALERHGADPVVHGLILQQPLPASLSIRAIASAVPEEKDVDGTSPVNQGRLAFATGARFVPATPAAVMLPSRTQRRVAAARPRRHRHRTLERRGLPGQPADHGTERDGHRDAQRIGRHPLAHAPLGRRRRRRGRAASGRRVVAEAGRRRDRRRHDRRRRHACSATSISQAPAPSRAKSRPCPAASAPLPTSP